uniref:Uncharacterized protein n=1 Tax=Steinernema glaseri TaxID=37863 RepID=A0A1I8AL95_9BILA
MPVADCRLFKHAPRIVLKKVAQILERQSRTPLPVCRSFSLSSTFANPAAWNWFFRINSKMAWHTEEANDMRSSPSTLSCGRVEDGVLLRKSSRVKHRMARLAPIMMTMGSGPKN